MVPSFCGAMGFAGWIAMLAIWAAMVALVVWGIARLFPDQPDSSKASMPAREEPEKKPSPLIGSGRR